MPTPSEFERWFRFDAWANRQTLASLKSLEVPPAQTLRWMAYVATAQFTWVGRIRGESQRFQTAWPNWPLEEIASRIEELAAIWAGFLGDLPTNVLDAVCEYSDSRGRTFRNKVSDILTHVLFHSMHHRGQIAAAVRMVGGTPAGTDFIYAVRESFIE